jgi:hypothetical protein
MVEKCLGMIECYIILKILCENQLKRNVEQMIFMTSINIFIRQLYFRIYGSARR